MVNNSPLWAVNYSPVGQERLVRNLGYLDDEDSPSVIRGLDQYPAMMFLDDSVANSESESSTAFSRAEKRLKNPVCNFVWNSWSIISDAKLEDVVVPVKSA